MVLASLKQNPFSELKHKKVRNADIHHKICKTKNIVRQQLKKGTKREVEGDQNQNEELEEHEVANARGEFEDSGVTTAFGNIFTLF